MADQPKLTHSRGTLIISKRATEKSSVLSSRSAPDFRDKDNEKLREETFQNWLLSKKQQETVKKNQEKKMREMIEEQKKIKKEAAELSYALWKHSKYQEKKEQESKERKLREEQAREKRLKEQISRERVNQWMSTSKYKPRPIRSNLGLLSLTETNPPSFFNSKPWVDPV